MNLTLEINKWYALQMIPGYNGEKYFSPIKIHDTEYVNGTDSLKLYFYNACYEEGIKNITEILDIIFHSKECMICEIQPIDEKDKFNRVAIIQEIDYPWLRRYFNKDKIDINISIDKFLDKNFR